MLTPRLPRSPASWASPGARDRERVSGRQSPLHPHRPRLSAHPASEAASAARPAPDRDAGASAPSLLRPLLSRSLSLPFRHPNVHPGTGTASISMRAPCPRPPQNASRRRSVPLLSNGACVWAFSDTFASNYRCYLWKLNSGEHLQVLKNSRYCCLTLTAADGDEVGGFIS